MQPDNANPLLATKLTIPSTYCRKMIARPWLYQLLEAGVQGPLTLIKASAGFGKTTLVAEWVRQTDRPISWISLEPSDNQLQRFWLYIVTAFKNIYPSLPVLQEKLLFTSESPQFVTDEHFLTTLINALATLPHEALLVLDDYQTITNPAIHHSMQFLLDHLPTQLHLLILTRSDFPLPIARLRVQGKVCEINAEDLRFTYEETERFFNQVMSLPLTKPGIDTLYQRTEGWIAGLQLAAIALQGHDAATIQSSIASFSGTQRNVLHYLTEEVLIHQPASIQDFLLNTSLLHRFNPDLCNAVTGLQNSQELLEQLEAQQLFLHKCQRKKQEQKLETRDSAIWYRYEPLFTDLLRYHLTHTYPDRVTALHERASYWFEQHTMIAEAIEHALAADLWERVADLLEHHVWSFVYQGQKRLVYTALQCLSAQVINSRPGLSALQSWSFYLHGQIEESRQAMKRAESLWQEEANQPMLGHLYDIQAYQALLSENDKDAIYYAQCVQRLGAEDDLSLQGSALVALGGGLLLQGELKAASENLQEGYRLLHKSGYRVAIFTAMLYRSKLALLQGNLRTAEQMYRQIVTELKEEEEWEDRHWYQAQAYTQLAHIYCEWNDLSTALQYAHFAQHLLTGIVGGYGIEVDLALVLAHLAWIQAEHEKIAFYLDQADQSARNLSLNRNALTRINRWRVDYLIAQGDLPTALTWDKHYEQELLNEKPYTCLYEQEYRHLIEARLAIAQDQPQKAVMLLKPLIEVTQRQERHATELACLILLTLAYHTEGSTQPTLHALEKALILGEKGEYLRLFADEGPVMAVLLTEFCSRYQRRSPADRQVISLEYIYAVLTALGQETPSSWIMPQEREDVLFDTLSEREHAVLRLIAEGLSNQEIARNLVVTVSTVKTHLNNIYAKLHVHTRLQAVTKAYDLGLLIRGEVETEPLKHSRVVDLPL